jgi:hypothetical protein
MDDTIYEHPVCIVKQKKAPDMARRGNHIWRSITIHREQSHDGSRVIDLV